MPVTEFHRRARGKRTDSNHLNARFSLLSVLIRPVHHIAIPGAEDLEHLGYAIAVPVDLEIAFKQLNNATHDVGRGLAILVVVRFSGRFDVRIVVAGHLIKSESVFLPDPKSDHFLARDSPVLGHKPRGLHIGAHRIARDIQVLRRRTFRLNLAMDGRYFDRDGDLLLLYHDRLQSLAGDLLGYWTRQIDYGLLQDCGLLHVQLVALLGQIQQRHANLAQTALKRFLVRQTEGFLKPDFAIAIARQERVLNGLVKHLRSA